MQSQKRFTKFAPGDSLKSIGAGLLNSVVNNQEIVERLANRSGGGVIRHSRDFCKVMVQNKSGAVRTQWDVLCPDDLVFDHAANPNEFKAGGFCLTGQTPSNDYRGKFLLLLEGLPVDGIGWALMAGVCPAYIDVQTIGDGYADVYDGNATKLKTGNSGAAQILWKASTSSTGPMWAIVKLGKTAPLSGINLSSQGTIIVAHNGSVPGWYRNAIADEWPWSGEYTYSNSDPNITITKQGIYNIVLEYTGYPCDAVGNALTYQSFYFYPSATSRPSFLVFPYGGAIKDTYGNVLAIINGTMTNSWTQVFTAGQTLTCNAYCYASGGQYVYLRNLMLRLTRLT